MICLFLYTLISIFKVSEGVLECRDRDCVLCDCWNKTQIPMTLTCGEFQIIRLEFYKLRRMRYSYILGDSCNDINNETFTCFNIASQTTPIELDQKLDIYYKCNAKRTCSITFPTRRPVKVEIPYVCEQERYLRRISHRFAQNDIQYPIFLFSGKEYTKGQILDCECRIEIPKRAIFEAFFIYVGSKVCNNILFSKINIPIFSCTDNGLRVFYGNQGYIEGNMTIRIKDLLVEGDEFVYFKLIGESMSLDCTGCTIKSEIGGKGVIPGPSENPTTEKVVKESFKYHIIVGSVSGILAVVIFSVALYVLYRSRKRNLPCQRADSRSQQNGENGHEQTYDGIDYYTSATNNTIHNSGSHEYLDLINRTDGYLTPQFTGTSNTNTTREDDHVQRHPPSARISTGSSYNRVVKSN